MTGVQTCALPIFMLESRDLTTSGANISYRYDRKTLSRSFPNLDADLVTMTLFASIADPSGQSSYAARVVALLGIELLAPPLPSPSVSYSFAGSAGLTRTTAGNSNLVSVGYGRIQPAPSGAAPAGLAIFSLRQDNRLVSEAAVPASRAIPSGRIYAEIGNGVDTGIAFANPNTLAAVITFSFTDESGASFGSGSTTIPAGGQLARFLSQAPFNGGASARGTFSFTSTQPVGAIALRGFTNERSQFLITTLPVVDISASTTAPIILPQVADGGGWTTQILLVNPTDQPLTGNMSFLDSQGQPLPVTIASQQDSTFNYAVAARSSRKFQTAGESETIRIGSVKIVPSPATPTPTALAVFAFKQGGITVTETGVRGERASSSLRVYAEFSGTAGGPGSIQTGVAIANPANADIRVDFELTNLAGVSSGLRGSTVVPRNGQTAVFLNQIPGFESLRAPFQGLLHITTTSSSGVAVAGLRGRYNEAGDFLVATTPPVDETAVASSVELLFPHWADGAGYTTQFILFNPGSAVSSGTLRLFSVFGVQLDLGLR